VCPGTLLLGNARGLMNDTGRVLRDGYERCGPIFRIRAAWRRYTIIAGREAADFMAQDLDKRYLSRGPVFGALQREFGPSDLVLAVSGPPHARLRPMLAVAYSRQVASAFVPAMIEAVRRHASRWSPGTGHSVYSQTRQMAFAQYCEMLGPGARRLAYADGRVMTDYTMNVAGKLLPEFVLAMPWYRAAHKRTYGILTDLVRTRSENGAAQDPPTLLDALAAVRDRAGAGLTDDGVVSYAVYGIGASCGYVSRLASFLLYEILRDPSLYAEIVREVRAAFAEGLHDATALRRMRILRSAYDETLRFHPIGIGLPFAVNQDFSYCGYRVRKGDAVVISPVPASFSPETFPDPGRFDAARCREPRNEHRRDGASQPFGLGDRTCVAMGFVEVMVMTMVATLLHAHTLVMDPPGYRLGLTIFPLPAPNRRFRMRAESPRTAAASTAAPSLPLEEEVLATFPGHDDPEVQQALANAARRRFAPGSVIIRQGDVADAFYLLESGSAAVTIAAGDGERQVAELGEGEWFGETGLLQNAPRNATVTAGPNGADTLVLGRDAFLALVATSDFVASEIGRLLRKRTATTRLRQAAPSLSGGSVQRVLPEFTTRAYRPGEVIIRQGDAAAEFFVVTDGQVEVSRVASTGVGGPVAQLGPGDYFGEMGLLSGALRNATVTAGENGAQALVTNHAGFERLLSESGGAKGDLARSMLARLDRLTPRG
jgi:cytochrome P450/CRP-like cAMP-binding protein